MDLQSAISGNDADSVRATDLLRADHHLISGLFAEFREALAVESSARGAIAQELCAQLEMHTRVEAEVFYPGLARENIPVIADSLREHRDLERYIQNIKFADPADSARLDACVLTAMDLMDQHVTEQERVLFPLLDKEQSAVLARLGDEIKRHRERLAGSTADLEGRS